MYIRGRVLFIVCTTLFLITFYSHAETKIITGNNYIGCQNKAYLNKLVSYSVGKDLEAYKKSAATGLYSGECTIFKSGEEIFVVDTAVFSGLIKIRRKGDVAEFWTFIEAI